MKDLNHGYDHINKYLIAEYGNVTEYMKVRAYVEHMGEPCYEVAVIRQYTDGEITFDVEFMSLSAIGHRTPVDMVDIQSAFTPEASASLQSLVCPSRHENIEKMVIQSPIALLSSRYTHVTDNSSVISVQFPKLSARV